jgi:hypothetical protein
MEPFKVICVNDRFKPSDLGQCAWIKKGEVYTVIDAQFMRRQNMSIGYKLEEIALPEDSPYKFLAANRFRPYKEDDTKEAEKAVENLLDELFEIQQAD